MTSENLNEIVCECREASQKAHQKVGDAIKQVLRENGGKIDTLYDPIQIVNEQYDCDELIEIKNVLTDSWYWLYGLQLGEDNTIEFIVVDPTSHKGHVITKVLKNQCLDYDIFIIADALETELENIEYHSATEAPEYNEDYVTDVARIIAEQGAASYPSTSYVYQLWLSMDAEYEEASKAFLLHHNMKTVISDTALVVVHKDTQVK